jgi:hypothetical protein
VFSWERERSEPGGGKKDGEVAWHRGESLGGHLIARKQEVASKRWPAMVLRRARRCLLSQ